MIEIFYRIISIQICVIFNKAEKVINKICIMFNLDPDIFFHVPRSLVLINVNFILFHESIYI